MPIAAEVEDAANKVVERAKRRVAEESAVAAQEAASAETTSLVIGISAALLLIVTCIFSVFTIARPMRALSVSMQELAEEQSGRAGADDGDLDFHGRILS